MDVAPRRRRGWSSDSDSEWKPERVSPVGLRVWRVGREMGTAQLRIFFVCLVRVGRVWLADRGSESGFGFDSGRGLLEGFARAASGRGSRRRGERLPSSLEL